MRLFLKPGQLPFYVGFEDLRVALHPEQAGGSNSSHSASATLGTQILSWSNSRICSDPQFVLRGSSSVGNTVLNSKFQCSKSPFDFTHCPSLYLSDVTSHTLLTLGGFLILRRLSPYQDVNDRGK